MALSVRQHMALNIAGRRYAYPARMHDGVRHELGWTAGRYHQVVNSLLDNPDAEATYPALIHRLRRLRDSRQAQRGARRVGFAIQ